MNYYFLITAQEQRRPGFYIEEVCEDAKPYGLIRHKKSPLHLTF